MKSDKQVVILVFAIFLVMSAASTGLSHPPASLDLSFSENEGILSISISHPVGNVSAHYIKRVNVTVDGRQAADLYYVRQGDKSGENILVTIGWFDKGTQISVIAECSRFGVLERKIIL